MPIPKVSFEESLGKTVVESRLCVGCATCVISCPFNCLEYADYGPRLISECKVCGICAQVCPRFNLSIPSLERFIFGRERKSNEEFGVYKRIVMAQTTSSEVSKVCQDGGVVTSLLIFALEEGFIDGAALSSESLNEPLKAIPMLATSKHEILKCAGTKYTYSPNILAFKEGVEKKIGNIAFVGTPCQIHALRKIQMLPLRKYAKAIGFMIGLFCSECFTYEGLIRQFFQKKLGIKLDDIERVNIKGKMILKLKNGEVRAVSLKEAKKYSCDYCAKCSDFSAELADISVGGLGLEGWSLTIIRTEMGDEIFQKAESKGAIKVKDLKDEDKRIIDLLIKMSRRKRRNPQKFNKLHLNKNTSFIRVTNNGFKT